MITSTFFIKSDTQNLYLFNMVTKSMLLLHPYVGLVYNDDVLSHKTIIKEDLNYYQEKIRYLEKYGLISQHSISKNEFIKISKETVEENLANLHQLTLEVTEKCNLKCKYCIYGEYYSEEKKQTFTDLPNTYVQNLIDYLDDCQKSTLNRSKRDQLFISFYGGEPLLNPNLISKIVDYNKIANKFCNREIKYTMTTNGTLLKKHIGLIKDNDIGLLISLDGDRANNEYRVYHNNKESFSNVYSNTNMIKRQYPDFFNKNVDFNSVLHNKNSVSQIYNFFNVKFGKTPSIGDLNNSNILPTKRQDFDAIYTNKEDSLYQAENYKAIESDMFFDSPSYNSAIIFLLQYSEFAFRTYEDLLIGKQKKTPVSTGTCSPFSKKMFLTVDGKILPCEKVSHKYSLGQVTDVNVSIDPKIIAQKYNDFFSKLKNHCKQCYRQDSCIQCIFFLDNLEDNPVCFGFTNKIKFVGYVTANISFLEKNASDYARIMKKINVS